MGSYCPPPKKLPLLPPSRPAACSAWKLRQKMSKRHGGKLTEQLYQWFTVEKKTLSHVSAGTFLLINLPEPEAIAVLMNAHELISGGGIPWHKFVRNDI
jgi:hypothetical protein